MGAFTEKQTLRIGVLQMRAPSQSQQENTQAGLRAMEQAAGQGVDLLLFPECFITGYQLPISNEEAMAPDSPCLEAFRQKARELSMGVVVTALTQGEQKPRNTAFIIDRSGDVILKYDKVHTCDFSLEHCLESGQEFFVCDFDGVKLGVMICYDREYPESARVLMLKGAEIILVPNDCQCMKHRVNALETRAYENMTGVVMANPPGEDAGRSCAFSPIPWDDNGERETMALFIADETTQGLFIADYDLQELRAYRSSEMMGNTFRKPQAYQELLNPQVLPPFVRELEAE